jgi:hypothetical protein
MAGEERDGVASAPAGLDVSVAHPARVYNYLLGGKDNFAADREAARQMIAGGAKVLAGVRANRAFLGRAVRFLAQEAGVRQFLVRKLPGGIRCGPGPGGGRERRGVRATTQRAPGPGAADHPQPEEIGRFFDGLEMTEPGLAQLPQWRPDLGYTGPVEGLTLSAYCGVGRKP